MPLKCKIKINLPRKEGMFALYEIGNKEEAAELDWMADYHKDNTFRIIYEV
jgi:hypothetical protein